jgi:hypothetical protein
MFTSLNELESGCHQQYARGHLCALGRIFECPREFQNIHNNLLIADFKLLQ